MKKQKQQNTVTMTSLTLIPVQTCFYSDDTDINSSASLLLPPHRPTSPAAPDGLVW